MDLNMINLYVINLFNLIDFSSNKIYEKKIAFNYLMHSLHRPQEFWR
jgi:hypothetical protein